MMATRIFPNPAQTVKIEITRKTQVAGKPAKPGDVVEVNFDDAQNILAAGRGKFSKAEPKAEKPKDEQAPEPTAKPKK